MKWWPFGRRQAPSSSSPRASVQELGGGVEINTPDDLERALRGAATSSGAVVNTETAMRVAAVYACVRIISGAVATMPLHLMRRVSATVREPVDDDPVAMVLRRRPNAWQTPAEFRRMATAHVLMRGNAYAMKVMAGRRLVALLPLDPDRVTVAQGDDLALSYRYRRRDGGVVKLAGADVLHLRGMSFDGIRGVTPITYARETIGLSLAMENHGGATFKNGARPSTVLSTDHELSPAGRDNLAASFDRYRAGGEAEGKALILEEGLKPVQLAMTAEDTQWIEGRKFSRTDIAMFFGVPPHMIGDTSGSTSWGSGIEQQSLGFVAYTLEDYLTAWEQTVGRDLLADMPEIFARFNRAALVRGDIKTRKEFYVSMLQWGVVSPNEVRGLEDMNPRAGGDVYFDPPNTAGTPAPTTEDKPQ